ncbi:hypothetical protein MKW98_016989 [Papaver atlanticum]|uniref:Uncharacterized protein n=1 Tax=Papaver atlanticum TaxID=357466 RepID=A0AAD4TK63_9MAGN|nr:hypothetical protein MKW98_016989 [Papaver atlanticum]
MASKILIFRKSAMEAGNPGRYYINPSEKLMSMAPDWKVVEHEDAIELISNRVIFDEAVFGDIVIYARFYKNQTIGDSENKDDEYGFIMNTDFLEARKLDAEIKDGFSRFYVPKIKVEENKKKNNKNQNNKNKNKKKN